MMQNPTELPQQAQPVTVQKTRNPNESAGLNIDEHLKIFDPNTREVHLEKRA